MKDMIIALKVGLFFAALIGVMAYLFFSFTLVEIDFRHWPMKARGATGIVTALSFLCFFAGSIKVANESDGADANDDSL